MTKFLADSSCDALLIEGANFESVPLTVSTGEQSWVDDESVDIEGMLNTLEKYKGRSYSACPPVDAWLKAFDNADIIYIGTLTGTLSGAYNSAMIARSIYLENHPERKVAVFDTLTTGPELYLFMKKLVELDASGLSFREVCMQIKEYRKHTKLLFCFRSLHNFAMNGRVSKTLAAAIGVLKIRIIGTTSPDGRVQPITKSQGDQRSIQELMKQLELAGYKGGRIRLGHADNPEFIAKLMDLICKKYPGCDISLYKARGLTSYYGERGAIFLAFEI